MIAQAATVENRAKRAGVGAVLLACGFLIAACGGADVQDGGAASDVSEEVRNQIVARQANFQDIGAAFKAVGDELKAGRPTSTTANFSIKSVASYAPQVKQWFPEGSGPETGIKMEAKALIWEDADDFKLKYESFEAAVAELAAANAEGNGEAIAENFRKVGGTCKACHDKFREDN